MIKFFHSLHPLVVMLIATIMEVSGDALMRKSVYNYSGLTRAGFAIAGMLLLTGYGIAVNLTAVEFGRVAGLYIATLFVVWQVINYFTFGTVPSLPVIVGGTLIVCGGLIVTFWKTA